MSGFDNKKTEVYIEKGKIGTTKTSAEVICLHILHHASKGPVLGLWFIGESRRMYRATRLRHKVLIAAREKVSELFGELLEDG